MNLRIPHDHHSPLVNAFKDPTTCMTTQGITKFGERTRSFEKGIISTLPRKIPNIGICQVEDAEEYQIPLKEPVNIKHEPTKPSP